MFFYGGKYFFWWIALIDCCPQNTRDRWWLHGPVTSSWTSTPSEPSVALWSSIPSNRRFSSTQTQSNILVPTVFICSIKYICLRPVGSEPLLCCWSATLSQGGCRRGGPQYLPRIGHRILSAETSHGRLSHTNTPHHPICLDQVQTMKISRINNKI